MAAVLFRWPSRYHGQEASQSTTPIPILVTGCNPLLNLYDAGVHCLLWRRSCLKPTSLLLRRTGKAFTNKVALLVMDQMPLLVAITAQLS